MKIYKANENFPMPIVNLADFHVDLKVRSDYRWTCSARGLLGGYYFRFNEKEEVVYPSCADALEALYAAFAEYFEHIRKHSTDEKGGTG